MPESPTLQRISSILLIFSIFALAVSVAYLLYMLVVNAPSSQFQKKVVVNYMLGDEKVHDDTYNYYTGNDFMQLSLKDGSKRKLTDYNLLTDVESIYWLKNGAVFNFSREPLLSGLSNMISDKVADLNSTNENLNLDSPENLYWYVNFSNGQITYLTYTDNPFGISSSSSGDYIYFPDNLTDSSYNYFGSVSSEGVVNYGIFGAPIVSPSRVIGQDKDNLYIAQQDEKTNTISLQTFDTSTYTQEVLIDDIYEDSALHTVYEDVFLFNDSITTLTVNQATHNKTLTTTTLSTKERRVIYTGPESSTISYAGDGLFTISDSGEHLIQTRSVDIHGDSKDERITAERITPHDTLLPSGTHPIFISRPYIYINPDVTAPAIDDRGIEKGYSSEQSSFERDIYSQTGDINTYRLYIATGSLKQEYQNVVEYIKGIDVDINDVTIIPQLGREASYDL